MTATETLVQDEQGEGVSETLSLSLLTEKINAILERVDELMIKSGLSRTDISKAREDIDALKVDFLSPIIDADGSCNFRIASLVAGDISEIFAEPYAKLDRLGGYIDTPKEK